MFVSRSVSSPFISLSPGCHTQQLGERPIAWNEIKLPGSLQPKWLRVSSLAGLCSALRNPLQPAQSTHVPPLLEPGWTNETTSRGGPLVRIRSTTALPTVSFPLHQMKDAVRVGRSADGEACLTDGPSYPANGTEHGLPIVSRGVMHGSPLQPNRERTQGTRARVNITEGDKTPLPLSTLTAPFCFSL